MSLSNIAGRTAITIVCRHWLASSSVTSLGHCRDQHACQSRSKVLDHFDSDCVHDWRRPGPARTCREFEPTRRKRHWRDANDRRSCAETGGAGSRIGPAGDYSWHAHQSEKSIGRVRETRTHSRRPLNSESNSTFCTSAPTQNLKRPSRPFRQSGAGALVIGTDAFFNNRLEQLATFALRDSVPAIYEYHQFVAAGGLASYGGSII